MASGVVAALAATLVLGFVEGLRVLYPARATWWRLRRVRGRRSMRLMRERFERAAARRTPRVLALVLAGLLGAWIAASSLLDKRWHEVALDVLPYTLCALALLRTPPALRTIAERMKEFERQAGEDPDADLDEDGGEPGSTELAL